MERIIRQKFSEDGKGVVVVRSSFGQVTEYDVYRATKTERGIERGEYLDGGTKQQAQRLFDRTTP